MATRGEIGDQNVGTGVFQYGECDCMRRKVENEADCGDICVCAHQFILSKNDPLPLPGSAKRGVVVLGTVVFQIKESLNRIKI